MNKPLLISLTAVLLAACGGQSENTPTQGTVKILVDKSLVEVINQEKETFESIYSSSSIELIYGSDAEAVDLLLKDSADMAILTRPLDSLELEALYGQKIWPETVKIATDAVALITNVNNPDSLLTSAEIGKMLKGEVHLWSEFKAAGLSDTIRLVMDDNQGGIAKYLLDSVMQSDRFSNQVYAVNSNEEVINYVKATPGAIGFIGVNWLSDMADSTITKFNQEVKVLAVSNGTDPLFYKPFQAYIATKNYPFTRTVYAINREGRAGLASGFTAFLASERGQRIILKSGLVPATMPLRIVQLADSIN